MRLTAASARMTMRVNSVSTKLVVGELHIDRQQRQRRQQQRRREIAQVERAAHLPPAENRPSGLTTSTTAISR